MKDISYFNEGFNKGFLQLRQKDVEECTKRLYAALGINNPVSFSQYRNGKNEFKITQVINVTNVFESFGIKNVWGK
jgi:hypothetical protein